MCSATHPRVASRPTSQTDAHDCGKPIHSQPAKSGMRRRWTMCGGKGGEGVGVRPSGACNKTHDAEDSGRRVPGGWPAKAAGRYDPSGDSDRRGWRIAWRRYHMAMKSRRTGSCPRRKGTESATKTGPHDREEENRPAATRNNGARGLWRSFDEQVCRVSTECERVARVLCLWTSNARLAKPAALAAGMVGKVHSSAASSVARTADAPRGGRQRAWALPAAAYRRG